MFNLTSRFQNATNQALSSSIAISILIIGLTLLQLYKDQVWSIQSTSISNIKARATLKHSFNYGAAPKKPKENSKINFDLDADLSPLFNWNTKQVFVYLTAEYPGKSDTSSNKITYWDKIITDKDDAKISLRNQASKYSVWDIERSFRSRDAIVRLEWNIQPHIGPLIYGETNSTGAFSFASLPAPKKA
ncbi:uncharacterized protein PRCAT00006131001 [Priceomyces carsonii]|uniref:uncharacterized protein n=1 Tax=Priceomyces carsonii TaxID=28549 RepID=UPI002EDB885E|nr:unnamed protein product [Priceomyces carsonii]